MLCKECVPGETLKLMLSDVFLSLFAQYRYTDDHTFAVPTISLLFVAFFLVVGTLGISRVVPSLFIQIDVPPSWVRRIQTIMN